MRKANLIMAVVSSVRACAGLSQNPLDLSHQTATATAKDSTIASDRIKDMFFAPSVANACSARRNHRIPVKVAKECLYTWHRVH